MLRGEEVVYPLTVVFPVPVCGRAERPGAAGMVGYAVLPLLKIKAAVESPLRPVLALDENPRLTFPPPSEEAPPPPTPLPCVNITPMLPRHTVFGSLWYANPKRGPKFFQ